MRLLQTRRRAPTRPAVAIIVGWIGVWFITRAFLTVVYRLRCRGAEHVPPRGAIIYIANHQSHYDPPAVGSLVYDRPFASMAKSALFQFKPFGWLIGYLGAMPLQVGSSDVAAVRGAIRELQGGGCVLLFPEGGRTRDGAMRRFKPGVLTLVRRTGAPVVPVAVEGTYDIWPRGRRFPRLRGRILVEAGPPIPAAELLDAAPDEVLERLRRLIETRRLELRAQIRASSRGRYPPPDLGDRPYWETEPTPAPSSRSAPRRAPAPGR